MFNLTRWKINRITKKVKSMQLNRVNNPATDQQIKREILLNFELANLLKSK